jgi:hypothetical protein
MSSVLRNPEPSKNCLSHSLNALNSVGTLFVPNDLPDHFWSRARQPRVCHLKREMPIRFPPEEPLPKRPLNR